MFGVMAVKKRDPYQYWLYAAGIFIICGCIHLFFDWIEYSNTLNSAPFSVWILLNAVGFGGAAAICLIVSMILRKKSNNRKDDT